MFVKRPVTVLHRPYMAKVTDDFTPATIPAYVAGGFAIHRPLGEHGPSDKGWTVSHVVTGHSLGSLFCSQRERWGDVTLAAMKERVRRALRFKRACAILDGLEWGNTAGVLSGDDLERVKGLANSGGFVRTGNTDGVSCYVREGDISDE